MEEFSQEILFNPEQDDFEHPTYIKVMLCIFSAFIIISSFIVIRRLLIFVKRPKRRILDYIVDFQSSITIVLVFIDMAFFNLIMWAKVPKAFVSEVGCYIGNFLYFFWLHTATLILFSFLSFDIFVFFILKNYPIAAYLQR